MDDGDNPQKALLYCSILALQFGLQPVFASKFTASGVSKSSVVIATEVGKIIIAFISIMGGPSSERVKIRETWTLSESLRVAALPATLYAIQNLLVQYGYQHLDSMTFNLLNQTKTLAAAFWLWVILGKKQSLMQMLALLLLLIAAIILNLSSNSNSNDSSKQDEHDVATAAEFEFGLLCVAAASMLSGLSAALTQRALVTTTTATTTAAATTTKATAAATQQRHPLFFSAELAVYGIVFLLLNLIFNSSAQGNVSELFSNWELLTLIPVLTSAFGGLVVGLVTKYAGGVVKGFALIAGILITGVAQYFVDGKPLGSKHLAGVVLVSFAIFLHASFPYKKPAVVTATADESSNSGSDSNAAVSQQTKKKQ